jgi:hypothetical protein
VVMDLQLLRSSSSRSVWYCCVVLWRNIPSLDGDHGSIIVVVELCLCWHTSCGVCCLFVCVPASCRFENWPAFVLLYSATASFQMVGRERIPPF